MRECSARNLKLSLFLVSPLPSPLFAFLFSGTFGRLWLWSKGCVANIRGPSRYGIVLYGGAAVGWKLFPFCFNCAFFFLFENSPVFVAMSALEKVCWIVIQFVAVSYDVLHFTCYWHWPCMNRSLPLWWLPLVKLYEVNCLEFFNNQPHSFSGGWEGVSDRKSVHLTYSS